MLETIMSYIIIIAPSLVTIIGAIATIANAINKMRTNSNEAKIVAEQAKNIIEDLKNSPMLQEILTVQIRENNELKKTITLLSEELRNINNLHPEWKDTEDKGE